MSVHARLCSLASRLRPFGVLPSTKLGLGRLKVSDPFPANMRVMIDECHRACEGIVDTFGQGLKSDPLRPFFYHYTNGAGFRGILETGKLWLTDIFNRNDPSELKYGFGPAIKLLEEAAEKGPLEVKIFVDDLVPMLRGRVEEIAHYFVCCFSRTADDLGQWRAYADNGRGFAIGFDGRMLEERFTKGAGASSCRMSFPLTYGNDPLRQMYQQIIDKSIPFVSAVRGRDLNDDAITKYLEQLSINVSVTIVRAALFFKHQVYSNEGSSRCPRFINI